jgi:hypothetical protein
MASVGFYRRGFDDRFGLIFCHAADSRPGR